LGEQTFIKSTIIKCAVCAYANIFNQPYPYHAGFSDQGFLYDDAGHLTLIWSCYDPAFKALLGSKCPWSLNINEQRTLENALRPAPSGGRWRFGNPARCLSCSSPISDSIDRTIYYLIYDGSVQTDDGQNYKFTLDQQLHTKV
jgi:hypothetical protein